MYIPPAKPRAPAFSKVPVHRPPGFQKTQTGTNHYVVSYSTGSDGFLHATSTVLLAWLIFFTAGLAPQLAVICMRKVYQA